jgi:hypothetical protein
VGPQHLQRSVGALHEAAEGDALERHLRGGGERGEEAIGRHPRPVEGGAAAEDLGPHARGLARRQRRATLGDVEGRGEEGHVPQRALDRQRVRGERDVGLLHELEDHLACERVELLVHELRAVELQRGGDRQQHRRPRVRAGKPREVVDAVGDREPVVERWRGVQIPELERAPHREPVGVRARRARLATDA